MEEVSGAKKVIERFCPDHEVVGIVGYARHPFPLSGMSSFRVDMIDAKVVAIFSLYIDRGYYRASYDLWNSKIC